MCSLQVNQQQQWVCYKYPGGSKRKILEIFWQVLKFKPASNISFYVIYLKWINWNCSSMKLWNVASCFGDKWSRWVRTWICNLNPAVPSTWQSSFTPLETYFRGNAVLLSWKIEHLLDQVLKLLQHCGWRTNFPLCFNGMAVILITFSMFNKAGAFRASKLLFVIYISK